MSRVCPEREEDVMPEVSVVLPTFNRWRLLSRALDSVLRQVEVDLEVLVVDDDSDDATVSFVAAHSDPRVRLLRQESNQGVARARNRGVAAARGEWVAFLDDDDFWAPTRLRDHLQTITEAGASWGYGAAIAVSPIGRRRLMMPAPADEIAAGLLELNVVGPPSTATVRRDLLDATGGFDDELSVIADWDLWVRLADLGPAARCAEPLVAYWDHPAAMHHTRRPTLSAEIEYLGDKYADLVVDGRRFGDRAAMRKAVGDDRLAGRRVRAAGGYVRLGFREHSHIHVLRGIALLGGEGLVARLSAGANPAVPMPEWLEDVVGEPAGQATGEESLPIFGLTA
jgi:glycosyltransferase involved in cell wall biosynthesis